jgi:SLT domain-containing protein
MKQQHAERKQLLKKKKLLEDKAAFENYIRKAERAIQEKKDALIDLEEKKQEIIQDRKKLEQEKKEYRAKSKKN